MPRIKKPAKRPTCPDCRVPVAREGSRCRYCAGVRRRKPSNTCTDCKAPISQSAARCGPCNAENRQKGSQKEEPRDRAGQPATAAELKADPKP